MAATSTQLTVTAAQLNMTGVTAGTAEAGKFLSIDGSSKLDVLGISNTITSAGTDNALQVLMTLNDNTPGAGTQEARVLKVNLVKTDTSGWDSVYLADFQIDSTSVFTIDDTGNVGIGTTSPGAKLQLASFTTASDSYIKIASEGTDVGDYKTGIALRQSNDNYGFTVENDVTLAGLNIKYHQASAAGASAMFIDRATGNVGIGMTSPDRLLHPEVSDAVTNTVTYAQRISHISSGTVVSGFGTGVEFELEENDGTNRVAGAIECVWTDAGETTSADADIVFKTMLNDGAASEVFRMFANGNAKAVNNFILNGTGKIYLDGGSDTYIYQSSADILSTVVGGVEGIRITESGGGAIPSYDVTATITASTTQTQGQQPLISRINEVSVVANANDVVTMPSAVSGMVVTVINNGANTLGIFPASGDDNGSGVDTVTNLASGSNVTFAAIDATTWEAI